MDRFIDKVRDETHGELVGDLAITRIPLEVYRARNATSRRWRGRRRPPARDGAGVPARGFGARLAVLPVDLARASSARSSWPATSRNRALLGRRTVNERYEAFMYQQWLRVYMRTQMIKHNKDVLESVDDTMGLLAKLHVY